MTNATPSAAKRFLSNWSFRSNAHSLVSMGAGTFDLINIVRFFGFVWVLTFHTIYIYGLVVGKEEFFRVLDVAPAYLWWVWNADKAVDLFFVVSGFLISLILFKELDRSGTINKRRFYFRRYLRLTPLYAVIVLIYWISHARNYEWVWTNLLYINNFLPLGQMALQWTWSLAVEEQFYLILPLLLLAIAKTPSRPFVGVMIALLVLSLMIRYGVILYYDELRIYGYRDMLTGSDATPIFYTKLYDNLVTRYGPFVCGVIVAHYYFFQQDRLRQWLQQSKLRARFIHISAFALMIFFGWFPIMSEQFQQPGADLTAYLVFHRTLFCIGFSWVMLMMFMGVLEIKALTSFFSWRIWQLLSQLTYSMYLIHFLVAYAVLLNFHHLFKTQPELTPNEVALYTTVCTIGVSLIINIIMGILFWLLIEKPFLNMRDNSSVSKGATHAAMVEKSA